MSMTPNPAVDPVRFALWTLRDKAAQRRSPLRWAAKVMHRLVSCELSEPSPSVGYCTEFARDKKCAQAALSEYPPTIQFQERRNAR